MVRIGKALQWLGRSYVALVALSGSISVPITGVIFALCIYSGIIVAGDSRDRPRWMAAALLGAALGVARIAAQHS